MGGEGVGGEPSWIVQTGSGGCDSVIYEVPVQKSPHVDDCSPVSYVSDPPTSGPHYGVWATYKTYDAPLPWGYLVHGMEHGGIVLSYDCTNCDSEILAMQTYIDGLAPDPSCFSPINRRITLVPADLDVPFAAVAWGFMLKGQCFDETIVAAFAEEHYAKGPEDVCAAGIDPLAQGGGGGLPADCGQ
jgi:hypothetical protein